MAGRRGGGGPGGALRRRRAERPGRTRTTLELRTGRTMAELRASKGRIGVPVEDEKSELEGPGFSDIATSCQHVTLGESELWKEHRTILCASPPLDSVLTSISRLG